MTALWRVRTTITGVPGAPYLSTHYFDTSSGTVNDAIASVAGFWTDCQALISTDASWEVDGAVTVIESTTGQPIGIAAGTLQTGAGQSSADLLPMAAQALARWHTGVFTDGRELRGRTFIPALTEDTGETGGPNITTISAVNNAIANMIGGSSSIFVIYSRKHHTFSAAVNGSCWNQYAVLRSRRD